MSQLTRRYRFAGREGAQILEAIRNCLLNELGMCSDRAIFQCTGGRSGDLAKEVMEYTMYTPISAGGWNLAESVHVYSVVDDSTNGYGHAMSILMFLPDELDAKTQLLQFLEDQEFVSSYSSFRERPFGYKSFRPYLDDLPDLKELNSNFRIDLLKGETN